MKELKVRTLTDNDWDTLCKWWESWPEWVNPPKSFLPDNGKGGFMVEKNNRPICAGFIYMTNSDAVLLEWIVSDPEYRDNDRKQALELLIKGNVFPKIRLYLQDPPSKNEIKGVLSNFH